MASASERESSFQAPRLTPESPDLDDCEAHSMTAVSDLVETSEQPDSSRRAHNRGPGYISRAGHCEVVLTPFGPVKDSVGARQITIDSQNCLITVGRSSRNKTKGLLPDLRNAYFDSPVMSRLHAWLKCDDNGKVLICDARSMHGTYVNGQRLEPSVCYPLETGYEIRFGNSVTRGSETFRPKEFVVEIIQKTGTSEIQHGYGLTSDELVLPDSPYSSEDEDDDIMITDVKPITKSERDFWNGESLSDDSATTGQEPVQEQWRAVESPSIIKDTSHVDLTIGEPAQPPIKVDPLPSISTISVAPPRISISELLAQERREQSRQSSQSPVSQGFSGEQPIVLYSDDEDDDYRPDIDEDADSSDIEPSLEIEPSMGSAPVSPISTQSSEVSKASIPVPDIQTPPSLPVNQPPVRVATLDELVSPEIKQAWTSTWKAQLCSSFTPSSVTAIATPDSKPLDFASPLSISRDSITNLANRTKLAMEQVRKAEALRDRAHDFLRSRIEMQNSRNLYTPTKDSGANETYPTPQTMNTVPRTTESTIPFWVRTFGQGPVETKVEPEVTSTVNNTAVAAESPCEGRGAEETCSEDASDSAGSRSPSPSADDFQMSDDEEDQQDENEPIHFGARSHSLFRDDYSEDEEGDSSDADSNVDMKESFELEISSIEDDSMDYQQSQSAMEQRVVAPVEDDHRSQTVKNAMSMENFFSPNDEKDEEVNKSFDWCGTFHTTGFTVESDTVKEISKVAVGLAVDEPAYISPWETSPPTHMPVSDTRKRKRVDSEEAEEVPLLQIITEDIASTRKIAPLPRRPLASVALLAAAAKRIAADEAEHPMEIEQSDESAMFSPEPELEASVLDEEPERKKPRVETAGPGWGSTLATALAGALVGGVGVFAALVATAGDM
ncbi:hypothetical protein ABW21_db0200531 [Orbilia brochopaga]|nr:hypothetical protein ABW21_db0200531 [Drechslerella brochopaga]